MPRQLAGRMSGMGGVSETVAHPQALLFSVTVVRVTVGLTVCVSVDVSVQLCGVRCIFSPGHQRGNLTYDNLSRDSLLSCEHEG